MLDSHSSRRLIKFQKNQCIFCKNQCIFSSYIWSYSHCLHFNSIFLAGLSQFFFIVSFCWTFYFPWKCLLIPFTLVASLFLMLILHCSVATLLCTVSVWHCPPSSYKASVRKHFVTFRFVVNSCQLFCISCCCFCQS